jgi:hypothetical protein
VSDLVNAQLRYRTRVLTILGVVRSPPFRPSKERIASGAKYSIVKNMGEAMSVTSPGVETWVLGFLELPAAGSREWSGKFQGVSGENDAEYFSCPHNGLVLERGGCLHELLTIYLDSLIY